MCDNIKLGTNIQNRVRIQVLYDVIRELSKDFSFTKDVERVLHDGIITRQLLGSIKAYYMDHNNKTVGMVRFIIDWDKYNIYAKSEIGRTIEINTDRPLLVQFALWSKDIVNYIQEMQRELKVKKVEVRYTYRKEINDDPEAYAEANKFLGLINASEKRKFDDEKGKMFDRKMNYVSKMLPELEIEIQSNSKRSS